MFSLNDAKQKNKKGNHLTGQLLMSYMVSSDEGFLIQVRFIHHAVYSFIWKLVFLMQFCIP